MVVLERATVAGSYGHSTAAIVGDSAPTETCGAASRVGRNALRMQIERSIDILDGDNLEGGVAADHDAAAVDKGRSEKRRNGLGNRSGDAWSLRAGSGRGDRGDIVDDSSRLCGGGYQD